MKKGLKILIIILLILLVSPINTLAGTISTINVSEESGKITATGEVGTGVNAVAAVAYKGNDLVSMETCSVENNNYSCTFSNTFENGTYTIKIADYNGGEYISKEVTVNSVKKLNNPKTGDEIKLYSTLLIIGLIGSFMSIIYLSKRKKVATF